MERLNLKGSVKNTFNAYIQKLRDIYQEGLISVILYGSAVSGEFTDKHSDINLIIVLKDTNLKNLTKSSRLINKRRYIRFYPVFFTEDYINSSCDVFPIEFLDMQENYVVLFGKDVLKDLKIDTKNLRFQCEQELKLKLINIRRFYLINKNNKTLLKNLLVKSCTSTIHILRNLVRLKNKKPAYLKEEVLNEIKQEFNIDISTFIKILEVKNRNQRLTYRDIESLLFTFVGNLEKIVTLVDRL